MYFTDERPTNGASEPARAQTMLVNCQGALLNLEQWAGSLPEWPIRRGFEIEQHSFLRTALSTPGFWKKYCFESFGSVWSSARGFQVSDRKGKEDVSG